jgi:hypothetical protein
MFCGWIALWSVILRELRHGLGTRVSNLSPEMDTKRTAAPPPPHHQPLNPRRSNNSVTQSLYPKIFV